MLRMAGALADGVMLSDATEGLMPPILAALEAGRAAAGRAVTPFPVSNFWAWHIKQDREQSMAEARRELVWRGALLRSHISHCLAPQDVAFVESHWQSFYQAFVRRSEVIEGVPARIVQALIDGLTFAGDANDVPRAAARLRSLEAAGQTQIALRLFDDPEAGVRSIGELLLPQLARHDPNPLTGAQAWK
jgi:alkanesulfonate monooxygenase SsuD/methylene tetrahydromethanopterin reductase-like flavin-dependent oxidoreductase (luciferase family)